MRTQLRNAIAFTSLFASLPGVAQFNALPDSNATWMTSFWIGPGYPYEGYFHEYDPINTDTIIGGEVYQRILLTDNFGGSYYAGALRDNELGQVYFCAPSDTPKLLYDFDVLPGDTVQDVMGIWLDDIGVYSVDTILVNGTPRKRIGIECLSSPGFASGYWIQGIGGTGGLLLTSACASVSGSGTLVCMTENDTIQYGTNVGAIGACDIYLGMVEENETPSVSLRPNPSQGQFLIGVDKELILHCSVFDPQGRTVLRVRENTIDLSGHAPGVYTVLVQTDHSMLRAPLVLER
ncbi:MAG: T9SS type A sorting domain-containing protein [Flavobacteriales bacterium]|nr:T9SS type A sorting domain-containing protein [Flavobacteriales bacterium]